MTTESPKSHAAILQELGACSADAIIFARRHESPQAAWDACDRGDWMLWLLGRLTTSEPWSDERKPLLACCLDCAETVKHLWPERQREKIAAAVAVLRDFVAGAATKEQAQKARGELAYADADAAYADAAVAAAAYAADAADVADVADVAASAATYAAYARAKAQAETADIVRRHFPTVPTQ